MTDTVSDKMISGKTIVEALNGILSLTSYTLDDIIPQISMIQRRVDEGGNYLVVNVVSKDAGENGHVVVARIDHEFETLAEIQAQMDDARKELVK